MQWLTKLDFKILHSIQDLSCSTLDFLMPKITILGNGGILWVLIAIFLLFNSRTRKSGIQLGAGCVGCVLIGNLLLKYYCTQSSMLDRRTCHVDCNAK